MFQWITPINIVGDNVIFYVSLRYVWHGWYPWWLYIQKSFHFQLYSSCDLFHNVNLIHKKKKNLELIIPLGWNVACPVWICCCLLGGACRQLQRFRLFADLQALWSFFMIINFRTIVHNAFVIVLNLVPASVYLLTIIHLTDALKSILLYEVYCCLKKLV